MRKRDPDLLLIRRSMLMDSYKRVHDYLRISLTDSCNLRCFYCMPEEKISCLPHQQLMQPEEILAIAQTFVELGVKKIRLTGGEPLVRKEAGAIIGSLSRLPVALTLTTNGVRLQDFAGHIQEAGIKGLNISLDTLQREKYFQLTRRDQFQQVFANVLLLAEQGLQIKVNMVVMKGINEDELPAFIRLAQHLPLHIRFIEFMPFAGNGWQQEKVMGLQEILHSIASQFDYLPLLPKKHDTARNYQVEGFAGTFGVISTMTAPFCGDCNRIRLTADGKMKNCLFSRTEVDLLSALRRGEDIRPLIIDCISSKAKERGGQFTPDYTRLDPMQIENRSMIAIGG